MSAIRTVNSDVVAERAAALQDLPILTFRLPGQWWQIPLSDERAARAAIGALVDTQVGSADNQATLRRDLKSRMLAALDSAIAGDGQSMQIALTIVPETPMSASLLVFLPNVFLTPAIGTAPSAVMDVLRLGLETATDISTMVRFATSDSEILRLNRVTHAATVVEQAAAAFAASADAEKNRIPALMVDYWMTVPGFKRAVLVSFSTVYADLEEVMLTLFDSIIRASYWRWPVK